MVTRLSVCLLLFAVGAWTRAAHAESEIWQPASPAQASTATADSNAPGPLPQWRKQLNRYTPRLVADASTWSLEDRLDPVQPEGPLRFQAASGLPQAAPTWSLTASTDYADLRKMVRGRVLQWQPLSAGDWKLGVAVGPARVLSLGQEPAYVLMPTASYQTIRQEWRLGVVASSVQGPTVVLRLKMKAF